MYDLAVICMRAHESRISEVGRHLERSSNAHFSPASLAKVCAREQAERSAEARAQHADDVSRQVAILVHELDKAKGLARGAPPGDASGQSRAAL